MYKFENISTGRTHQYSTLNAAMRAKDRIDAEYGGICTTYPSLVSVERLEEFAEEVAA